MRYFYHKRSRGKLNQLEHYVCTEDSIPPVWDGSECSKYIEIYIKQDLNEQFDYLPGTDNSGNGFIYNDGHIEITKEEYEESIFLNNL